MTNNRTRKESGILPKGSKTDGKNIGRKTNLVGTGRTDKQISRNLRRHGL